VRERPCRIRPFGIVFVFALPGFGDCRVRKPSLLRTWPGRFPPGLGCSSTTLPAPCPQQHRGDKSTALRAACSTESRQSRESVADILNDGRLPKPGAGIVVGIVPLGLQVRECARKRAHGRRKAQQDRRIRAGLVSSGMLKPRDRPVATRLAAALLARSRSSGRRRTAPGNGRGSNTPCLRRASGLPAWAGRGSPPEDRRRYSASHAASGLVLPKSDLATYEKTGKASSPACRSFGITRSCIRVVIFESSGFPLRPVPS
jgi:hypothetical protein